MSPASPEKPKSDGWLLGIVLVIILAVIYAFGLSGH